MSGESAPDWLDRGQPAPNDHATAQVENAVREWSRNTMLVLIASQGLPPLLGSVLAFALAPVNFGGPAGLIPELIQASLLILVIGWLLAQRQRSALMRYRLAVTNWVLISAASWWPVLIVSTLFFTTLAGVLGSAGIMSLESTQIAGPNLQPLRGVDLIVTAVLSLVAFPAAIMIHQRLVSRLFVGSAVELAVPWRRPAWGAALWLLTTSALFPILFFLVVIVLAYFGSLLYQADLMAGDQPAAHWYPPLAIVGSWVLTGAIGGIVYTNSMRPLLLEWLTRAEERTPDDLKRLKVRDRAWAPWTIVSLIAAMLSAPLGNVFESVLSVANASPVQTLRASTVIPWLTFSLLVAVGQWLTIRRIVPRALVWIPAAAVAYFTSGLMPEFLELWTNMTWPVSVALNPDLLNFWGLVIVGLIEAIAPAIPIAVIPWLILTSRSKKAWLWVPLILTGHLVGLLMDPILQQPGRWLFLFVASGYAISRVSEAIVGEGSQSPD